MIKAAKQTDNQLVALIKDGDDQAAWETLLSRHQGMINKICGKKRLKQPRTDWDELTSLAHEGFVRAVKGWDETREQAKFSTYLFRAIKNMVDRAEDSGPIRVPYEAALSTVGLDDDQLDERGRHAKAAVNGIERIGRTRLMSFGITTGDQSVVDQVAELELQEMRAKALKKAIGNLTLKGKADKRGRKVIREYYFKGKTQKEIAGGMKVSETRVMQIQHRAIKQMREGRLKDVERQLFLEGRPDD